MFDMWVLDFFFVSLLQRKGLTGIVPFKSSKLKAKSLKTKDQR
jgi:hypothetical protein